MERETNNLLANALVKSNETAQVKRKKKTPEQREITRLKKALREANLQIEIFKSLPLRIWF